MKFTVKYRTPIFPWNKRLRGIVLYPFIFMRPYTEEHIKFSDPETTAKHIGIRNRVLFRHELQHAYQIKREGVIKFYIKYLWFQIKYGYRDNPYEIEAENIEQKELTVEEEKWFKTGKVEL